METGERVTCNPDELRRAYSEAMRTQSRRLYALAAARGMLYLSATTDESFYPLFDALSR